MKMGHTLGLTLTTPLKALPPPEQQLAIQHHISNPQLPAPKVTQAITAPENKENSTINFNQMQELAIPNSQIVPLDSGINQQEEIEDPLAIPR